MESWSETLTELWHGRREDVFRVRVPPIALSRVGDNAWGRNPATVQTDIEVLNSVADAVFETTGWSTIDMPGIAHGHEELYEDGVHIPGRLSRVAWHVLLSSLCGDPLK